MNGRNSYFIVGIFVSVGIVTLIVMSLIFAGGRSTEPTTRYTVFFERDISGLTLGAPVRYLGVGVDNRQVYRLHPGGNDGFGARRRSAEVAAGL